MNKIIHEFNKKLERTFGFNLYKYQEVVSEEIISQLEKGARFVTVSMPTGSGKTVLEMLMAEYLLSKGHKRVLVLEPTRFLCDQMRQKWKLIMETGKEYEGNCQSFLEDYKVVISTPQTALKCIPYLRGEFDAVIIDEVHHAITGKFYNDLISELKPEVVIGFTALLPSKKVYQASVSKIVKVVGPLILLHYDFQKLSRIDPKFKPPKALVDIFDSELNHDEELVYNTLYLGRLPTEPRTIYFLERTFSRYGKKAFCESFSRAIEKGKILKSQNTKRISDFCKGKEPSHKARTLVEILTVYNPKENPKLKPIIVFTSRKATAYEFREVIIDKLKIPPQKVEVLTSDLSKEERKELVLRAKKGFVDIIVSTLVGEEGVDIPEAGVLAMTDVPKSPLRFYQRLGRLIRISSPMKTKIFVITMTPKTEEYEDLGEAVYNLYKEGVNVSYILLNIEEKLTTQRLLDYIGKMIGMLNSKWVSYMLLTQGNEPKDPIEYYLSALKSNEKFRKAARQRWGEVSDEELDKWAFMVTTMFFLRWDDSIKKAMKEVEKTLSKGKVVRDFDGLILDDKLFYFYDPEGLSDMVFMELQRLREECKKNQKTFCENVFLRFDRKGVLRLFTNVFPIENLDDIMEDLKERVSRKEKILGGSIYVSTRYNPRSKAIIANARFSVSDREVYLRLEPQFNYYNFVEDSKLKEKKLELVKLNVKDICYRAKEKYLEIYGELEN